MYIHFKQNIFECLQVESENGTIVKETSKMMPPNTPQSIEKRCWIYARQMMLNILEKAPKSKPKGNQLMTNSMQEHI